MPYREDSVQSRNYVGLQNPWALACVRPSEII